MADPPSNLFTKSGKRKANPNWGGARVNSGPKKRRLFPPQPSQPSGSSSGSNTLPTATRSTLTGAVPSDAMSGPLFFLPWLRFTDRPDGRGDSEHREGEYSGFERDSGDTIAEDGAPHLVCIRTNTHFSFLQPPTQLSHRHDTTDYVMNSLTSRNTTSSRTLQMAISQPMKASPKKLLIPRKIPLRQQRKRHGHQRYEKRLLSTSTSMQLYPKSRRRSGFTSNLRATNAGISIIAPNTLSLPSMMPSKTSMA